MNQKARGPNGRQAGAAAGDKEDVVAELVIAYDEALRTGSALPDDTATAETFDPQVRERLNSAKDCLQLIERVRQFRQHEAQELLPNTAAGLTQESAYTAGGTIHRIGRFEIVRELGRGSHGIVFLARDPALCRDIALKVPRPEAILTPQLRSRFLREGKAAARLNHPNILPVHEAGAAGPICYLVQSYCSGPSLAAWLAQQKNPVPCELAARIVAELADGVEHAHRQGILHRDIKPANVMLEPLAGPTPSGRPSPCPLPEGEGFGGPEGEGFAEGGNFSARCGVSGGGGPIFTPRLTDFGLAKALDEDPNATATVGAIGTATYMPPEQARGELSLVGPRSDVYSLGALLYELLTRRPPIAGVNQLDTLRLIASEDPRPLRELRGDVPRELEAICWKCLEKSPDLRYQAAAELAADLRRFRAGESVAASPQGRLRRTLRRLRRQPVWVLIGAATMAMLAAGLLSSLLVIRANRFGTIAGQTPPPNPAAEYLDGIGPVSQGYFDAVGNRGDVKRAVSELDAFLERHRPGAGQADYRGFEWHSLWRLCHPDRVARPFPKLFDLVGHKGEVYYVTFSPDGKRIATAGQDHTGRIWDAENGKLVAILRGHTDDVNWLAWFPADARFVLTASDDKTVRIWECESGKPIAILSGDAKMVAVEVVSSRHQEGDKTILEYEIIGGDAKGDLQVWNPDTRRHVKTIHAHAGRIECLAPIRGDDQWLTASSDGTAKEWNTSSWTCLRSHAVDSSSTRGAPDIHSVCCNADATLVALGSGTYGPLFEHPQKTASGTELLGSIPVDDLLTGNRWLTLAGPQAGKESVRFYPGQALLASGAKGAIGDQRFNHVLMSDLPTQRFWTPCGPSHPECWCMAFSPDGTRFATAATDGMVRVWDSSRIPNGTRLAGLNHTLDTVARSISYSPDGRQLLVSHGALKPLAGSRRWTVWDVSGKQPRVLAEERDSDQPRQSFAACFSPDGRYIALDETEMGKTEEIERSRIRILEADSLREIRRLDGYYGFARKIFLSPQGTSVVAATGDQYGRRSQLNFWLDSNGTRPVQSWESGRAGDFLATTLSPDRKLLATNRNQVEIYEFPSLRLVHRLPVDLGLRAAACFSPDGRLLAVSGDDGTIHVFQPQTASRVATLVADGHAALALAFSPDGSRLAAGLDGGARVDLWHVATGKRLTSLAMPTDLLSVDGLAFSPDGRTLAAAGARDVYRGSVFLFPLEPVDGAAGESARTSEPPARGLTTPVSH